VKSISKAKEENKLVIISIGYRLSLVSCDGKALKMWLLPNI
jgi:uncharacterized protein YyaL (SSP411 family)